MAVQNTLEFKSSCINRNVVTVDQIITGIEYLQNSLTETIRVEREDLYTTRNSYVGKNRYFLDIAKNFIRDVV